MHSFNLDRWLVVAILLLLVAVAGWYHRRQCCLLVAGAGNGRWRGAPALVTLLLLSAGLIVMPLPALTLMEIAWWLAVAALALLVGLSARHLGRRSWWALGGTAVLLMLVYALSSVDQVNMTWGFSTREDLTPGLANIRLFSDLAVGIMPLGLLYIVARQRPSWPALAIALPPLSAWWWILFVTEGRAGILSLVVAMAVALVLLRRQALWPVGALGLAALPGLAGWGWLNPVLHARRMAEASGGEVARFARDIGSSSNRFELWGDAAGLAIERFPFGVGAMQFSEVGNLRYGTAHNLVLNTAGEWGIPLALLLLALVLKGCWVVAKRSRRLEGSDARSYACLVMAFVGVIVNAQFAGSHIAPLSALVLALSVGLVFGFRGDAESAARASGASDATTSTLPATLLWAAMMLGMGYLLLTSYELYWLSVESTGYCFEEQGAMHYYPRFWAQGRIACMEAVNPDHWLFWNWR